MRLLLKKEKTFKRNVKTLQQHPGALPGVIYLSLYFAYLFPPCCVYIGFHVLQDYCV